MSCEDEANHCTSVDEQKNKMQKIITYHTKTYKAIGDKAQKEKI